jgi:hypothetical protein
VASKIKVDTLETADGTGSIALSNQFSGMTTASLPPEALSGTSVATLEERTIGANNGGTFTNGAWRTRTLNTEVSDVDGIVSLSSSQFTLQAGTYSITWFSMAAGTAEWVSRLQNITDSTTVNDGMSSYAGSGLNSTSNGHGLFVITGQKTFELQGRCRNTISGYGLGMQSSGHTGASWNTYSSVLINKL